MFNMQLLFKGAKGFFLPILSASILKIFFFPQLSIFKEVPFHVFYNPVKNSRYVLHVWLDIQHGAKHSRFVCRFSLMKKAQDM